MMHARRLAWNTALSFALNVTLRAAGVLAFIAIGRLSSVRDAGTFSLALGYLAILTTLFVGLDDILVRASARAPEQTPPLLATYGAIRLGLSIAAWLVLVVILAAVSFYPPGDLAALVVITSCSVIDTFSALGQSVQNAHGRFGWPLVAALVGAAVRLGSVLLLLVEHHGLLGLSFAWPLGSVFAAVIMISVLARYVRQLSGRAIFQFDSALARDLARLMPSFSAMSILAGLEYQLDVVLLSVLLSNEAVAWYSAAATIMMVVLAISQAYRMVLYPSLVRVLTEQPSALRRWVSRSLLTMGGVALLAAAVIAVMAPWLMLWLYGERFAASVPILQVLIWNTVLFFLNVPLARFMLAINEQGIVWRVLMVSLTVNLVANLLLIPTLGAIGPAYARLLSLGVSCGLIGWQVSRRLRVFENQQVRE